MLYNVNFNIYSSIEIEAKNKEEAADKVYNLPMSELLNIIKEEIDAGNLDIGTIEKIRRTK